MGYSRWLAVQRAKYLDSPDSPSSDDVVRRHPPPRRLADWRRNGRDARGKRRQLISGHCPPGADAASAVAVRRWMAIACSGTHKIPKFDVPGSRGARITQDQDSGCSENRVAMRFSRP